MTFLGGISIIRETDEQDALAKIRTLLALERNFMAEERTILAEFRTGLAIALIGPSASAVIVYLFSRVPINEGFLADALVFIFFISLTSAGIWLILRSRRKLIKIRKKFKILKQCKTKVVKSSNTVYNLMCDLLDIEEQ